MPNRILRDYTDSYRFEHLGSDAERLFVRLIVKADDYGRYPADPRMIRSGCFPLLNNIRDTDISRWLAACQNAGLVAVYEVQGRCYLAIVNFRQRLRLKKLKYPAPDGQDEGWQPDDSDSLVTVICPADDGLKRSRNEVETKGKGSAGDASPDPLDVLVDAWNGISGVRQMAQLTDGRRKSAAARLAEPFFRENYLRGVEMVKVSKFCTGGNDRGWKADFDWFVRPDTLAKIIEGKYADEKVRRDPVTGRPLR